MSMSLYTSLTYEYDKSIKSSTVCVIKSNISAKTRGPAKVCCIYFSVYLAHVLLFAIEVVNSNLCWS